MSDRFPLIANSSTGRIEELASGDNLNLQNSSIVGATTITANNFYGNLVGTATTSNYLSNAANITAGIVSTSRLSGDYTINIIGTATTSNYLSNAANITTGTISRQRLGGDYDINISGLASKASSLSDAANIDQGIIQQGRLSGSYNIDITGTANFANFTNYTFSAGVANTATNLSNASNILAGTISSSRLSGTYNISISGTAYTSTYSSYSATSGSSQSSNYASNSLNSTNVDGGYASVTTLSVSSNSSLQDVTSTNIRTGILTATTRVNSGIVSAGIVTTTNVYAGVITSTQYYGDGSSVVGIVTQLNVGIGLTLSSTQSPGKGLVNVSVRTDTIGKTIFVSMNGDDNNSGLVESDAKKTIKGAISIAVPGDTVTVFPGSYIEDNPIVMPKNTSINGSELRNCLVTPFNPGLDLFHTNDGCHITNISFVGRPSENSASVVSFKPLLGVSTDRFFDAARMIRMNLDFIASETVGYLTSTSYRNPPFNIGIGSQSKCKEDIKSIFKSICYDITRGGNSKCVGAGKSYYTESGALQHIVGVKTETIDAINYAAGIAKSCINNVLWNGNYQNNFTQVRDLSMQPDSSTGSNIDINSCSNVISALYSCVGVVTTIIKNGNSAFRSNSNPTGIRTTYPGNAGYGITSVLSVSNAVYDNKTGSTTINVPGLIVKKGDRIELRDLQFSCSSNGSGISTQTFPSGKYDYEFYVNKVNNDGSIVINTGVSTIAHNYVGGGFVVNRSFSVSTATYNNNTGIVTITAPGANFKVNDFVNIQNLVFSCNSGGGPSTAIYPSGKNGYNFKVIGIGTSTDTFSANVGVSTLAHTYVSGGVVYPPYSSGVGNINKGPYVRNCTNFIQNSIGMKVDGFDAEPGDLNDNGVTGAMSVDSYTQYNQGGIGVSITNGAYCQLVSIFTICDDIAIYTSSGGQCDITNSNASFGNYGLYSNGVGNNKSKSIYRYTGTVKENTSAEKDTVVISGIGSNRPYDGQAIYFGNLYYSIRKIEITNGGSNYTSPPRVNIQSPTGPNGITAEAIATIKNGSVVSVDLISTGNQYLTKPSISFGGGGGVGAAATVTEMDPIYYNVESATLPVGGESTVVLKQNLNNNIGAGTTVYFARQSLQIATTISFEWVGAGVDINKAKPALGGVTIQDNEVFMENGGKVVYTSTNQAGDFKIGDDLTINQLTGTISGRAFSQSLLNTVTPLIIALGR